jgi:hypothetical protein
MDKLDPTKRRKPSELSCGSLVMPTDLGARAMKEISAAMNGISADVFALYVKTKNFHWHLSGPRFRHYHLLFDAQMAIPRAAANGPSQVLCRSGSDRPCSEPAYVQANVRIAHLVMQAV